MAEVLINRRSRVDRRSRTLSTYLYGAFKPRRVRGRRVADRLYPIIDWHSPRVLAVTLAILLLSTTDGILTIILLEHGAVEINPLMALFVPHSLHWFAAVKLGLTGMCLIVLVACSQMRLLRALPGEILLYLVLGCYVVLIGHELAMLDQIAL
jgi:Domain of unknown function (DUF5658)